MNEDSNIVYKSLSDIKLRKKLLLKDIQKDEKQLKEIWQELFHKPSPSTALTPSRRISGFVSKSAGIFDAVVLGWKLYRKFGGKAILGKKKR